MKHFTKQSRSLCSLHGKIGIQMNNTFNTSKEKNYEFTSKKPSATKHSSQSNDYYMEFYRNFLFQYSLIGIVKPKNVRKKQDRTSLSLLRLILAFTSVLLISLTSTMTFPYFMSIPRLV